MLGITASVNCVSGIYRTILPDG
ncbi:MAG: hypothetical protein MZU97_03140 [Bacillus subtilis]|nr:hypothetical protein [Bacillus subtilis]